MFKKCLNCLKEIVGRNVNIQGNSNKVSDRNEEHILKIGGNVILVIKCQRTQLNYIVVFCGKQNLQVINLDI